jgi:auxin efflux carrier family protein
LFFFWVPHRFRWGFIVAGVWGNYGDIPTAVIMSITAAAPFNGTEDQNLAVAYIAAFVLVYMVGGSPDFILMWVAKLNTQITFFPMGGHYLIARDFRDPDKEDAQFRLSLAKLSMDSVGALARFSRRLDPPLTERDVEARNTQETSESVTTKEKSRCECATRHPHHTSSTRTSDKHVTLIRNNLTETPSEVERLFPSTTETPANPSLRQRLSCKPLEIFLYFLQTLLTVPTMAVIISLIIAVIQPLKALFVLLPSSPHAPDGQPPLAFIMDTATFLGGASVPLGLICLGSAMARLYVPRSEWRTLPLGSIVSLALGRMVLQPVLGVLIVQGLVRVGIISAEDKVLQFVCM